MAWLTDLRQRGLLDDTRVVWGGEFGRTPTRENRRGMEMQFSGRDHNPAAFTVWMAGGGVRRGHSHSTVRRMTLATSPWWTVYRSTIFTPPCWASTLCDLPVQSPG